MSDDKPLCKEPGLLVPVIERTRCEGKQDCVAVCPYGVFEMQILDAAQRKALPFFPRLKMRFHGWNQAFAVREQDCRACGLCVTACPEQAITLRKVSSAAE